MLYLVKESLIASLCSLEPNSHSASVQNCKHYPAFQICSVLGIVGLLGPIVLFLSPLMPNFDCWWVCFIIVYAFVNGLTYMTPIHHSWLWFPEKCGLASGIIMSGYGLSGLIFNNLALYLVNPDHISPGENGLYPKEVYDNVPHMLRGLAMCYATLVVISVVLIFPGPDPK
jgi:hypothetical protein